MSPHMTLILQRKWSANLSRFLEASNPDFIVIAGKRAIRSDEMNINRKRAIDKIFAWQLELLIVYSWVLA